MGKSSGMHGRLIQEAARIVCEDGLSDYRLAKQKAVERLGLGFGTPLPSNADVQEAVIQYQRLFGGRAYADRLSLMRRTAVQAMRMLEEFEPRLVGAVASGATTDAHSVQLHCFADKPEAIDWLLESRGLKYEVDERRYRYPDGQTRGVPVISFMAADVSVDVAVFPERNLRGAPLSPGDGAPMKRLELAEAEALAEQVPEVLAD
jgi:hypothetical protein